MLSYQHAYHAGGPADVHKHRVLAGLLAEWGRAPEPIHYVETHAGRGLYHLDSAEAEKTGEWRTGIGAEEQGDDPLWQAIAATCASHGPMAYPGSPMIAAHFLRPTDRMTLFELHPAENAALRESLGWRAEIAQEDGLAALPDLEPHGRCVALIDPSYEVKEEYSAVAEAAIAFARLRGSALLLLWYPILPAGRHGALIAEIESAGLAFDRDETVFPPHWRGGMRGSGLLRIGTLGD